MPSVPQLKSCCFCFTTETGTKIIGWLQTILSAIGILLLIFALAFGVQAFKEHSENEVAVNDTDDSSSINTKTITEAIIIATAISIVIYVISFLLGLFLLLGVYKRNMSYVRLWIIISVVLLILTLAVIVIRLILKITGKDTADIISPIVSLLISTYFTLVVYSYYRENKSGTSGNV
uniref:Putative conserved plasma membrane protein n=1 Tax=Panstrongylus megistus TaxID=65343 RepID=A0A069DNP8_9HEMI